MIGKHLGHTIDIHGGGQDLIFPHHENEIAQGTCAHGARYCHTWVHNSFVTVDGQKMSKSLGNVLLVRDLLAQAPGEAIRLALLSTHYRRPLDWNSARLSRSRRTLTQHYQALAEVETLEVSHTAQPDAVLLDALRRDLNVAEALARLQQLVDDLKAADNDIQRADAKGRVLASAKLLGLLQQPPADALKALSPVRSDLPVARIEALVAERENARQQRDFDRADALRTELLEMGIAVHDTPQGVHWHPREDTADHY